MHNGETPAGGDTEETAEQLEQRQREDEEERRRQLEEASFFVRKDGEGGLAFAVRVFERVYGSDIERLVRMEVRQVCIQRF